MAAAQVESPWIRAEDVSVTFDQRHLALKQLNVAFTRGEFTAVVGPSCCGKSTLLRLIAELQQPSSGRLHRGWAPDPENANRENANRDSTARDSTNRVGFVFQQPTLLPWRNVLANVGLPLELAGQPRQVRDTAARDVLRLVGLSPSDETKLPRMLSGGMQMRVSVARAIVKSPDVMLMDEPFAAVDDLLRSRLNEELLGLWLRQKWTTIFVTHHVHEAVFLSQRVLVMSAAPGSVVDEIRIPFPYPRVPELRGDAEFARLTQQVSQALRRAAS